MAAVSTAVAPLDCPLMLKLPTGAAKADDPRPRWHWDETSMAAAISVPRTGSGRDAKPLPAPWPLAVYVYGGPHVQLVRCNLGTRSSRGQRPQFTAAGCAVASFDGRGGFHRGTAFERALWRRMGTVEVEDQVAGLQWLLAQGLVKRDRIGVQGWSYGGYMTLRLLASHPTLYCAGVSGAPVTDWLLYDTAYTERYMGNPDVTRPGGAAAKEAYAASSITPAAAALCAPAAPALLLVHGNLDENVHFTHTTALREAVAAVVGHDAAPANITALELPGERHAVR
jgi:dipeptidyl-peptidase 4